MAVVVAMPAVWWADWTPLRVCARRVAVTLRAAIIDDPTLLFWHQPTYEGMYDYCCFDARTPYKHNYRTPSKCYIAHSIVRTVLSNHIKKEETHTDSIHMSSDKFLSLHNTKWLFSPLFTDSHHVLTPFYFFMIYEKIIITTPVYNLGVHSFLYFSLHISLASLLIPVLIQDFRWCRKIIVQSER